MITIDTSFKKLKSRCKGNIHPVNESFIEILNFSDGSFIMAHKTQKKGFYPLTIDDEGRYDSLTYALQGIEENFDKLYNQLYELRGEAKWVQVEPSVKEKMDW